MEPALGRADRRGHGLASVNVSDMSDLRNVKRMQLRPVTYMTRNDLL